MATLWDFSDTYLTFDEANYFWDGTGPGFPGTPYARVQATKGGFYGGIWRDSGDVFDIYNASDFSNSATNYGSAATPFFGWMTQVAGNTPLYSYSLSNGMGLSDPYVSVQGVDSAGHPLWSIPSYVV